ncbi:hypothetical protein D9756_005272 [Leucocoprinus leucothites]|uniref:W2 domain-containing protein n=1 Tax=Leucocoprinus leucothites TaxID=201217 RepID=A0A8H5D6T9_9AGAR|nr:hypothetical protein D9756_005272 [Leucoagaricus leucothites]
MSQQAAAAKPSLQGVRIKARKGAVKAQAKHEPTIFRDQLYKHLETVPEGDFESYTTKLIQAGSTLEFLKYADALFEIILVGGLLQPGGSYVDDGAPVSPFTVFNAKEPAQVDEIKKYIDVLNKLIRRYKYLQRPLESSSLPTLLQYTHRWTPVQTEKLSAASHKGSPREEWHAISLAYTDVSVNAITMIFRAYLTDQSMDHLSATLKRGGVKDLLAFFPPNKRDNKTLEEHFKEADLPKWLNGGPRNKLTELFERKEPADTIVTAIKVRQEENPIPEADLIQCIWQGCMSNVDWGARPDQIEGLALREVGKYAPILEPFCSGAKTQVTLINAVQVYCYEDTRIIKAFPQILKVLYNKDCLSDQAIIYWHQKGSKPQGRQHFIKSTETLVKFLQQDDSEEEEEE